MGERKEEHELLIERILVLARNVLQIPLNPATERRLDNDANVHDQIIWSLQQSGLLDIVLYILSSEFERQYHLHALEIIYLVYREQTAEILVDTSISATAAEKYRDEKVLVEARRREKNNTIGKLKPGRHSRFGSTFVVQNVKSLSDNPLICHQSIEKLSELHFDTNKKKQKGLHRLETKDEEVSTRRSVLAIRLFLREFCIEILSSAFNLLVRYTRHALERSSGTGHDDTYLLWAIRFFMEFNRLKGFKLQLVSEALSTSSIHWVVSRMHHHMGMMGSDKKRGRLWGKRLNIALQTYKELISNIQALQKVEDERSQILFDTLQTHICNMLEYRETALHLLLNFNERLSTRSYLKDVIETAAIYFKFVEKFCLGHVYTPKNKKNQDPRKEKEKTWKTLVPAITQALSTSIEPENGQVPLLEGDPEDYVTQIKTFLNEKQVDQAVDLLQKARKSFPNFTEFGSGETEQETLREIYLTNVDQDSHNQTRDVEINFSFSDFEGRLLNPKVINACTYLLQDWNLLSTKTLKATITILFRISVNCKTPVMLFQARLLRIFQQALLAPLDDHNKELKRLAVFIVRHLTNVAKTNEKVFAELLFFKTLREAEQIKNGYEAEVYRSSKGSSKWTEEDEDELRILFMRNQENPETDEDVIDWIVLNLENKNRTRRQVLTKLKALGLIFKAPTKRSTAASKGKRFWQPDEDKRLRELYDQYRLEDRTLDMIMAKLELPKSKNAVIKRMIELGLIADKSEVKPSRKKRNAGANKKKTKVNFDSGIEIPEKVRLEHVDGFNWILEQLTETLDDLEKGNSPDEGGVPLVTIELSHSNAIADKGFCKVLKDIGIQSPSEGETYWRIPAEFTKTDLKKRIEILKDALEGHQSKPSALNVELNQSDLSDSDSSGSSNDSDSDSNNEPRRQNHLMEERLTKNLSSSSSDSDSEVQSTSSSVGNVKESLSRNSHKEKSLSPIPEDDENLDELILGPKTKKQENKVDSDEESEVPTYKQKPPVKKQTKKPTTKKSDTTSNFGESAFTSSDSEPELNSWNPLKGRKDTDTEKSVGKKKKTPTRKRKSPVKKRTRTVSSQSSASKDDLEGMFFVVYF